MCLVGIAWSNMGSGCASLGLLSLAYGLLGCNLRGMGVLGLTWVVGWLRSIGTQGLLGPACGLVAINVVWVCLVR